MSHAAIHPPDEWIDMIVVSGDLRAPGTGISDDANYDARDALEARFPTVDFDPESSCFFAYPPDTATAEALVAAIDEWVDDRRKFADWRSRHGEGGTLSS